MKAQPIRSQLLFSCFIFANEVALSLGLLPFHLLSSFHLNLDHIVSPRHQTSLRSPGMTAQPLFTVKSSTDRVICSTNLIVCRRGGRCTVLSAMFGEVVKVNLKRAENCV